MEGLRLNRIFDHIQDLSESIEDLEELAKIYREANNPEAANRLQPWIEQDRNELQALQQRLSGANYGNSL